MRKIDELVQGMTKEEVLGCLDGDFAETVLIIDGEQYNCPRHVGLKDSNCSCLCKKCWEDVLLNSGIQFKKTEANEVFSKLINKELTDGDKIVVDGKIYVYRNHKIQNCNGQDLTAAELYQAKNIELIHIDYVSFEEAMNSGKRIKYDHEYAHTVSFHCLSNVLTILSANNSDDIVKEVLSSKCWLIEK